MIELEVQNFQSIKHATLTVDGFSAIVGRSNIGKSALVRAAQFALTGATGVGFVRHGPECDKIVKGLKKCKCFSRVTFRSKGLELVWEKGDNVNRYVVTKEGEAPQPYEGLDRGTPDFLVSGFQQVKVGDSKELIQIPDQFSPIFLLNQSGTVVADVMSDVANLDNINKASTAANKDRKDASSRKKVREEDVSNLKAALAAYEGLDGVPVQAVSLALEELTSKQALLRKIDGYLSRLASIKGDYRALEAALKPELSSFEPLERSGQALGQVASFLDELLQIGPVIKRLANLDQVRLPDMAPVSSASSSLEELCEFEDRLDVLTCFLDQTAAVADLTLPDRESLDGGLKRVLEFDHLVHRFEQASKQVEGYGSLKNLPQLDWDPLVEVSTSLGKAQKWLDRDQVLSRAVEQTEEAMRLAALEEASALTDLEALGQCPTCEQPLRGTHIHAAAV